MRQVVRAIHANSSLERLEPRQLMAFGLDAATDLTAFTGFSSATTLADAGNGKIWVGGKASNKPFILRLNADGQIDSTFHAGAPLSIGSDGQTVRQIVQLSNGKIEVNLQNAVTRLNANGTPDSGFGTGGTVKVKNNRSIAITATGAFYAAGNVTIAKYGTNGQIDSSWGNGGAYNFTTAPGIGALLNQISTTTMIVRAVPDGRVMLAISNGAETPRFGVLRVASNGTLNTTFAGDGTYVSPTTFDIKSLTDFVVLPDTQSLLLVDREDGATEVIALGGNGIRRDALVEPTDAERKNSFRFAGGLTTKDQATSLSVTSDGKALLNGGFADPFNPGQFAGAIARITPEFTLDRTTAPDGDGVLAAKLIRDTSSDESYAGQPVTSSLQINTHTMFAIVNGSTVIRLSDTAPVPSVTNVGNRLLVNGTAARDFVNVSGDSNEIDISINGEHFTPVVSAVTRMEIGTGTGSDRISVSGGFPVASFTIGTRRGNDSVTVKHTDTRVPTTILLGEGNDSASTSEESVIRGETGNDTIVGSAFVDALFGGDGNDSIVAGEGNDYVEGNLGNDTIDGGTGNDRIIGDEGNDILLGGNGTDTLYGLSGNDTLNGGAQRDYLDGGADNDSINAKDGVAEQVFGGSGIDSALRDVIDTIDGVETVS